MKLVLLLLVSIFSLSAFADDIELLQNNINTVWTALAAFMVFFMQAGFALVEMGLTRAKNAINIIMKNLMDFSVGSLLFFFVGYGLMFGDNAGGFFGTTDFMLSGITGDSWSYTFILFQTVFAATAATIVSGAMAERTIFTSYLIYSVVITGLIYPISGSWAWGGLANGSGWLENLSTPFVDFAGSTVVHSLGGWLALAGAVTIGPRKGKYSPKGVAHAIPGHNIPYAALGVFILWLAWFGFNAGSTTLGDGSIGRIAFITNISAVAGSITAMIYSWIKYRKPDVTMSLNGALAGLVGITAGCANVNWVGALIIGLVAGVIVTWSVVFIDTKLKIDDPVGAISVHGVCGAWGTIAVGLFGAEKALGIAEANSGLFFGGGFAQLGSQLIGVFAFLVWGLGSGFLLFKAVKKFYGLRVSADEEYIGLDLEEHGLEAYQMTK